VLVGSHLRGDRARIRGSLGLPDEALAKSGDRTLLWRIGVPCHCLPQVTEPQDLVAWVFECLFPGIAAEKDFRNP
jgi:hypothetical protein